MYRYKEAIHQNSFPKTALSLTFTSSTTRVYVSITHCSVTLPCRVTVDGNGNVKDVLDESGTVVAHYEYDPFGRIVEQSGAFADENPWRHSTKYYEPLWGLYCSIYRYYSPELGRWPNRDPIGKMGGPLYLFVQNRPIQFVDPLGLKEMECTLKYTQTTTIRVPIAPGRPRPPIRPPGYGGPLEPFEPPDLWEEKVVDIVISEAKAIYDIDLQTCTIKFVRLEYIKPSGAERKIGAIVGGIIGVILPIGVQDVREWERKEPSESSCDKNTVKLADHWQLVRIAAIGWPGAVLAGGEKEIMHEHVCMFMHKCCCP